MYQINEGLKKRLFVIGLLVGILLLYYLFYRERVLPNTYLGDLNLSSKTRVEAGEAIRNRLEYFESFPIVFKFNKNKVELSPHDLGISFNSALTLDKVYRLGKSDNFFTDTFQGLKSLLFKTNLQSYYEIDFNLLTDASFRNFSTFEKLPKDASIAFRGDKPVVIPEEAGEILDRNELFSILANRVDNLSNSEVVIESIEGIPSVKAEHCQRALSKVQSLQGAKIVFTWGFDSWKLADNNLLNILRFYPQGKENGYLEEIDLGGNKITILDLHFDTSPSPVLNVAVDEKKLDNFLKNVAKSTDRPVVNATLKFSGGRISEFTPAIDGQKLDLERARQLLLSKLSIDNINVEANILIPLPISVSRAKIASSEINSLGIRELIGRGVSYFSGSITNRIHNIRLGSSRISGTLVAPGEVFSFNKSVGEVSADTGYRQAYIISQGRTVLDDGGGICQVSTTVFRAALDAGLPIVSRTAHAYRVGYYEQRGFKPGLDATVWAPGVDFSFRNDTNQHILVQAVLDLTNSKLEVDIYGTTDGRKAEITSSVVSNIKPALPDKYQDDPALPKGTKKQVDFSAVGADVIFTRKIYRDNELLSNDVFKSFYRPWQAVYLVGTGS